MLNVDDFQMLTLNVRGWVGNWASAIDRARVHQVTARELLYGDVPEGLKGAIRASLMRRVQDGLVDYAEEQGLHVLATAPVEESWGEVTVAFRMRFLACEKAPVPPVEEWGRFG